MDSNVFGDDRYSFDQNVRKNAKNIPVNTVGTEPVLNESYDYIAVSKCAKKR